MQHKLVNSMGSSGASAQQHAILLRRLQRSQMKNALIQQKAQRFVNLRMLSRSLHLRRQLTQALAPRASGGGGGSLEPKPPPSLDPSVEALIEKLTEIAEILPSARLPPRTCTTRAAQMNQPHQQNQLVERARPGSALLENSIDTDADDPKNPGPYAPRKEVSEDERYPIVRRSNAASVVRGKTEGEDAQDAPEQYARAVLLNDDDADTDPENATMGKQLRELDSHVEDLFKDLKQTSTEPSGQESDATGGAREKNAQDHAEAQRKRAEKTRQKERVALLAQLGQTHMTKIRRPRWRWIEEGVPNPDPDRILKGVQFMRCAVHLVIVFFVRPKRNVIQRKSRSKDRDTQDWLATLTIYFDRCQTWLLKTSRVPIANSILKSPKLTFRINRLEAKRDVYGTSVHGVGMVVPGASATSKRSFVGALLGAVGRGVTHENLTITLMRLKVHAKGVLYGLTQEMPPSDIMTFFSYLAGDGNYFPRGFFFEAEASALSFDELGAVRKLAADTDTPDTLRHTLYALHPSNDLRAELEADAQAHHEGFLETHHLGWLVPVAPLLNKDAKGGNTEASAVVTRTTDLRTAVLHGRNALPGKLQPVYRHDASGRWYDTSLVEMVLTNYLMVRVLIPWILLYPRESGLTPASGVKPSLLAHNCQVLASVVYLIVRVLRPELTPPNADTMMAAAIEENERAKKKFNEGDEVPQNEDEGSEGSDSGSEDEDSGDEKTSEGANADGDKASSNPKTNITEKGAKTGGTGDSTGQMKKTDNKKQKSRRRRRPLKPRSVQQIMQQRRYLSLSDKQLVQGLLPDLYFMPLAEQMRPWVLELAAEFDTWMQKIVVIVMGKVESTSQRHERSKEIEDEQGI